jgi:hypothetical protein
MFDIFDTSPNSLNRTCHPILRVLSIVIDTIVPAVVDHPFYNFVSQKTILVFGKQVASISEGNTISWMTESLD